MDILEILQIIAAIATIITGIVSLVRPLAVRGFTGLEVSGPRGITEIRAVLGGAFIGLGAAPFILDAQAAYQMLGIVYLVIGAVRAVTMVIDKSIVQSNIVSLLVEIVFGVLLIL
ncbi:MAG: hypothetical protein A2Z14_15120 [Chloroflexi bacterium RBG_16_48_8]|nr:MAG: hypothetical protein A2Z14_15120 [Chloroflexi bacterium RBG_16_48_8]